MMDLLEKIVDVTNVGGSKGTMMSMRLIEYNKCIMNKKRKANSRVVKENASQGNTEKEIC